MRIGLFIPCYIDAFFPEVGIATLELLERFGHEVVYPRDQTCCGQPMANSGFNADCADTEALFVRNFSGFDYVVAPSGSCVHHVRDNFDAIEQTAEVKEVRARTYELVEFLHDILKGRCVSRGPGFRTASGCTTAAARCARSSMRNHPSSTSRSSPSPWICSRRSRASSSSRRRDRTSAAVSAAPSRSSRRSSPRRWATTRSAITRAPAPSTSSRPTRSCLMHQQGCAERIGVPIKFIHIAQILNGASA